MNKLSKPYRKFMFSIFEVLTKSTEQKPIIIQILHVTGDITMSLFHVMTPEFVTFHTSMIQSGSLCFDLFLFDYVLIV